MVSVYTVEKIEFRKMLKKFNWRYEVLSRKYFSNKAIPFLHNKVRSDMKAQLPEMELFSATTDMWSSKPWTRTYNAN